MDITKVKTAILYEKLTDYASYNNRTLNQEVSDISVLKPDLIFRGFWQWQSPVANSCNDFPTQDLKTLCTKNGFSYEMLKNSIIAVKKTLPNTIVTGAVPSQIINRTAYNPKTNQITTYPDTWNMALDPAKWGITGKTKEQLQCEFAQSQDWDLQLTDCSLYDPTTICCYFPDLTNPQFQEIFLSWAYSQIDAGVDGIWVDMFIMQIQLLYAIINDMSHPSIVDTINAIDSLINSIHSYGTSKGKQIYVGTWLSLAAIDKTFSIDFLTSTPLTEEVSSMTYDTTRWDNVLNIVRKKYPTTKIIGFIDGASNSNTPIGKFSQVLTHQQQLDFLKTTKNFFNSKNIIFAYPVHGFYMGYDATILSWGTVPSYDSKAPEFQSFDTIRQLITGQGKGIPSSYIIATAGLLGLIYLFG